MVHRVTTNDNEWQRVVQRVATRDSKWQWMTTSDRLGQQMTTSGTTNESEWKQEWF